MSRVKGFRKAVLRGWAARHLQPGTTVQSDGLACFRGVAEAGYHLADLAPRLVYASANTPPMPCRLLKLDESCVCVCVIRIIYDRS